MTGKERVTRAIEFSGPDRLPLNEKDMFDFLGDRNWIVNKWHYVEEAGQWQRGDIWGCYHRTADRSMPGYHVENHPLQESWDLLDGFEFPDPSTMLPHLEKYHQTTELPENEGKYQLLTIDPGPLLVIINLLEYENFLMQCIDNPDKVRDLYQRITNYKFELIKLAREHIEPDGVVIYDDWGSQRGPWMSPSMFADIFKPAVKSLGDKLHDMGMHYGLQASGDTGDLLDEYMDAGLDFLYETQIGVKGWQVLSDKIKGKLCLMSCCDIQTTLPNGTPRDVRDEVLKLKNLYATDKGGLVLLDLKSPGGIQPPAENSDAQTAAMYEACGLKA